MSLIPRIMSSTQLHSLVYIVADKPSKQNYSPYVPLVGTKSYRILLGWLGQMDIDVSRVRFFNQSDRPFTQVGGAWSLNQAIKAKHIKVVALGQAAMDYLLYADVDEFFVLPHPSPANRARHKEDLKTKLEQCKAYIYGETKFIETEGKSKTSTKSNFKEQEDVLPKG